MKGKSYEQGLREGRKYLGKIKREWYEKGYFDGQQVLVDEKAQKINEKRTPKS